VHGANAAASRLHSKVTLPSLATNWKLAPVCVVGLVGAAAVIVVSGAIASTVHE
jgi:hypothetical protein